MVSLSSEMLIKREKLIRAAEQFKKKEANLFNLKRTMELIRYVIKYLNRYPAHYKKVFRCWLDFIKDFILRSDHNLQIQVLTQISIVLMYVLSIRFEPIYLIEDILGDWIDLLVVVPIEVTSEITIRNHSRIHSIINFLKKIGHYKYQSLLVEILVRYLYSVDNNMRLQTINELFESGSLGKDAKNRELIELLNDFDMNHLEKSIRFFLNKFNACTKSNVSTIEVRSIDVGGIALVPPFDGKQWVDLNRKSSSLSFYGDSNSLLWNYFEIMKSTVESITRSFNFTVCIDLSSKLTVNYCVEEENHDRFKDIKNVSIEFSSTRAMEEFIRVITPILMNNTGHVEAQELQELDDLNASNTTLNISVLSRSIHNGDLDGRLSFMGDGETDVDDIDAEKTAEPVTQIPVNKRVTRSQDALVDPSTFAASSPIAAVARPTREKRKLYSNIQHELMEVSSQSTTQGSLMIVMNEEDLPQCKKRCTDASPKNHTTQVLSRPSTSRIYKTGPEERVPVYRTILDDWKSDAESTSYDFVNNDPPGMPTRKVRGVRVSTAPTRKTAPAKRPRATIARRKSTTTKRKTAPAKKKIPLDFVRQIIKRPCKEAAKEAKRVFGLKDTPPYHGHAESTTTATVDGYDSTIRQGDDTTITASVTNHEITDASGGDQTTITGNNETLVPGFYVERQSDAAAPEVNQQPPEADSESYAVFMKFIEEYRTLSMQMGDVMQGIRRLKTRIINSAKLTEYQKAGLLVELCNFLLKR